MNALWTTLESSPGVFIGLAALFGLFIGSFLNVVIARLPVMLDRQWRRQCEELLPAARGASAAPAAGEETFNLMVPRSRCPACGHPIGALENIPVVSYLWLRGKCRGCGQRISPRYPLVELLTATLSAVIAWRLGFTLGAMAAFVFTWILLALAFIDYDHQLLPDDLTLLLLWLGLLVNIPGTFAPLPAAVVGAVAGYASLWIIYYLFKRLTGKEGMGFGDFKLFAALGAWLGWQQLPLVILFASLTGAVTGLTFILLLGRDRHLPIPFGPFLCVAGWIALLWGDSITRMYLQYARIGV